MLVVVALGGNALLRRGEATDAATQRANVAAAVAAIAELAHGHNVVVTHGNGPQVGLLALQSDALHENAPYPLDVIGAESEGMIGYLLEQELVNQLPERLVATLLTQVIVDPDDPAFAHPTKPIGPIYDQRTARRLAAKRGWAVAAEGEHYRRVVASPEPRSIVELATVRLLVRAGVLVVCVGGGGIPVVLDEHHRLRGVEAVIDKDLSAALLATHLHADTVLMLTDVPVRRGRLAHTPRTPAHPRHSYRPTLPPVRPRIDGTKDRSRLPVRRDHRRDGFDRRPRACWRSPGDALCEEVPRGCCLRGGEVAGAHASVAWRKLG
jgi:carbamate kinase